MCTSAVLYGGAAERALQCLHDLFFFVFSVNVNLQKYICNLIAVFSLQYTSPLKMGKKGLTGRKYRKI